MTGTTGGLGTPGGDWYFISSLRWISFLFSSILRLISSTISLATSPAPFALVVVVVVRNIVLRRLPDDDFDVDEKTEDTTREFLEEEDTKAAWCWRHTEEQEEEEEEEEEAIVIIVLLPLFHGASCGRRYYKSVWCSISLRRRRRQKIQKKQRV